MKVKVCGITNSEDALLCESCGADALGFIFYEKSKRFIEPEKAKKIIERLSPFTLKTGVFVNEKVDKINLVSKKIGLNLVQLHGNENNDFVSKINLPVIKAFRVNSGFNFDLVNDFSECAILLDNFSKDYEGGTGRQFDWELIPNLLRNRIILSGGITIEHLDFILTKINPLGIDLSSSLEKFPGKKDQEKVIDFFNKLKEVKKNLC
jgi:phosphoribosylanthranilate isomerase